MKKAVSFLFISAAIVLLMAAAVQLLWNGILPQVMAVQPLNYGQALGLLVLCRLLFGGFGWGRPWYGGHPRRGFREKWMQMDETQRAQFKEAWKRRCEGK